MGISDQLYTFYFELSQIVICFSMNKGSTSALNNYVDYSNHYIKYSVY